MTHWNDQRRASTRPQRTGEGWSLAEHNLSWAIVILLALGVALAVVALLLLAGTPSAPVRVMSGMIGALAGGIVGASLSRA